ncbi:hypothetical protein BTUL_0105g00430 [Botrytis tulipae]|uniref:Uncharacterized protein n=1 Tax=Botrytis tulipae TaxID=87230 RepID=A0A4Z1EMT0_9HELO|nr:hypothetical protein BTUL_0105g00430 [Botrytis tulipae]
MPDDILAFLALPSLKEFKCTSSPLFHDRNLITSPTRPIVRSQITTVFLDDSVFNVTPVYPILKPFVHLESFAYWQPFDGDSPVSLEKLFEASSVSKSSYLSTASDVPGSIEVRGLCEV